MDSPYTPPCPADADTGPAAKTHYGVPLRDHAMPGGRQKVLNVAMPGEPTSAEPRLVCSLCGKPVKVVGIEPHPEDKRADLLTFECAARHVMTATFPE